MLHIEESICAIAFLCLPVQRTDTASSMRQSNSCRVFRSLIPRGKLNLAEGRLVTYYVLVLYLFGDTYYSLRVPAWFGPAKPSRLSESWTMESIF